MWSQRDAISVFCCLISHLIQNHVRLMVTTKDDSQRGPSQKNKVFCANPSDDSSNEDLLDEQNHWCFAAHRAPTSVQLLGLAGSRNLHHTCGPRLHQHMCVCILIYRVLSCHAAAGVLSVFSLVFKVLQQSTCSLFLQRCADMPITCGRLALSISKVCDMACCMQQLTTSGAVCGEINNLLKERVFFESYDGTSLPL